MQMTIRLTGIALAFTLTLTAGSSGAKELLGDAQIDHIVMSKLLAQYGIHSEVLAHVDLSKPFGSKSQWTLVVGKQPDRESQTLDGAGDPEGAVFVCFVKNGQADCSEGLFQTKFQERKITFEFGGSPFFQLLASKIVYAGRGETAPLIWFKACSLRGANGSCGISSFLFAYDRKKDSFHSIFFNITGRNNNQETRFVESGPLQGDVIVAYPANNAPYTYDVEVHKRSALGDEYARVLKYRGRTGYGDGNSLSVIDSEMPEILRRLGLWRPGRALPVPPSMPPECKRLVMRRGVEWCE